MGPDDVPAEGGEEAELVAPVEHFGDEGAGDEDSEMADAGEADEEGEIHGRTSGGRAWMAIMNGRMTRVTNGGWKRMGAGRATTARVKERPRRGVVEETLGRGRSVQRAEAAGPGGGSRRWGVHSRAHGGQGDDEVVEESRGGEGEEECDAGIGAAGERFEKELAGELMEGGVPAVVPEVGDRGGEQGLIHERRSVSAGLLPEE